MFKASVQNPVFLLFDYFSVFYVVQFKRNPYVFSSMNEIINLLVFSPINFAAASKFFWPINFFRTKKQNPIFRLNLRKSEERERKKSELLVCSFQCSSSGCILLTFSLPIHHPLKNY